MMSKGKVVFLAVGSALLVIGSFYLLPMFLGRQSFGGGKTIIDETFTVAKGDHKAVRFEVSGKTDVYWEYKADRGINFYLFTEEEYNKWKVDDRSIPISERKNRDSGAYQTAIEAGKYVVVWCSPGGNASVTAKFITK